MAEEVPRGKGARRSAKHREQKKIAFRYPSWRNSTPVLRPILVDAKHQDRQQVDGADRNREGNRDRRIVWQRQPLSSVDAV